MSLLCYLLHRARKGELLRRGRFVQDSSAGGGAQGGGVARGAGVLRPAAHPDLPTGVPLHASSTVRLVALAFAKITVTTRPLGA